MSVVSTTSMQQLLFTIPAIKKEIEREEKRRGKGEVKEEGK